MEQEKLYQKGFNAGYLLAVHEPALIEKILESENKSDKYFEGLLYGKKEYDRGLFRDELNQIRSQSEKDRDNQRFLDLRINRLNFNSYYYTSTIKKLPNEKI